MQHDKIKNKISLELRQKLALELPKKNNINCLSQNEFNVIYEELNLDPEELVDQEKRLHAKEILEIFKDLDKEVSKKVDKNELKTNLC